MENLNPIGFQSFQNEFPVENNCAVVIFYKGIYGSYNSIAIS